MKNENRTKVFAFNLAENADDGDKIVGSYDPETEVWVGADSGPVADSGSPAMTLRVNGTKKTTRSGFLYLNKDDESKDDYWGPEC